MSGTHSSNKVLNKRKLTEKISLRREFRKISCSLHNIINVGLSLVIKIFPESLCVDRM